MNLTLNSLQSFMFTGVDFWVQCNVSASYKTLVFYPASVQRCGSFCVVEPSKGSKKEEKEGDARKATSENDGLSQVLLKTHSLPHFLRGEALSPTEKNGYCIPRHSTLRDGTSHLGVC